MTTAHIARRSRAALALAASTALLSLAACGTDTAAQQGDAPAEQAEQSTGDAGQSDSGGEQSDSEGEQSGDGAGTGTGAGEDEAAAGQGDPTRIVLAADLEGQGSVWDIVVAPGTCVDNDNGLLVGIGTPHDI